MRSARSCAGAPRGYLLPPKRTSPHALRAEDGRHTVDSQSLLLQSCLIMPDVSERRKRRAWYNRHNAGSARTGPAAVHTLLSQDGSKDVAARRGARPCASWEMSAPPPQEKSSHTTGMISYAKNTSSKYPKLHWAKIQNNSVWAFGQTKLVSTCGMKTASHLI